METKPWYWSSILWAAVLEVIIGVLQLVQGYLERGDYSPSAVVLLITGVFIVIRRVTGVPVRLV